MADVSLYWFRDDLRLSDLPGLTAAAQAAKSSQCSCGTHI